MSEAMFSYRYYLQTKARLVKCVEKPRVRTEQSQALMNPQVAASPQPSPLYSLARGAAREVSYTHEVSYTVIYT